MSILKRSGSDVNLYNVIKNFGVEIFKSSQRIVIPTQIRLQLLLDKIVHF